MDHGLSTAYLKSTNKVFVLDECASETNVKIK